MTEHTFTATREMIGDRAYAEGDTRKLLASDAAALVRSGALVPKGAEAEKAMADIFDNEPVDPIVQSAERKTDAPLNKDAGNAPRNKTAKAAKTVTTGPTPGAPVPAPADGAPVVDASTLANATAPAVEGGQAAATGAPAAPAAPAGKRR